MARSRNIKPGFFENDELAACSIYARLLFVGMWTLADRNGRLEDRPGKIKYRLLPADDFDSEQAISELAERGFLLRYQVGDGRYLQVVNWDKHQSPHMKEQASQIPAPDMHQTCTVPAPELHPLDSLIPGLLDTEDSPPTAHAREDELPAETSPAERRVVSILKQTTGMATIPDFDVVMHLREVLSARGSPIAEDVMIAEAMKFRDHHNQKRSDAGNWRAWRNALTNWFSRVDDRPPQPTHRNGRRDNVADSMAAIDRVAAIVRSQTT